MCVCGDGQYLSFFFVLLVAGGVFLSRSVARFSDFEKGSLFLGEAKTGNSHSIVIIL